MVSARGDKKTPSHPSEYNTTKSIKSTKEYTSKEEELVDDEEEFEEVCWLDNSIKNLKVRMNKN